MAGRCVVKGKVVTTEEIPAYCAVALAGIGDLPDTVLTRSITVKMRRRAPTEYIEPYRRRIHAPEGEKLRVELARWTSAHESRLSEAWPEMPSGIVDREADVWEPLLAVADAAGEEWPELARFAARALVTEARESPASMGIRLLSDLFEIFNGHEVMSTDDLLKALHGVEESPWDDLYGKPLNPRGLSQRLRKYEVSSKTVRLPVGTAKGYARADLWDVWQRYTPELIRDGSVTDVTDDGSSLVAASSRDVTDVTDVTHSSGGGHSEQPAFDDEVIF
jgi:hypothetical protein